MRVGVYIDGFNLSYGSRGLSRGTCELTEFRPGIGVKTEAHHFRGHGRATAITDAGRRAAKLSGARSMP